MADVAVAIAYPTNITAVMFCGVKFVCGIMFIGFHVIDVINGFRYRYPHQGFPNHMTVFYVHDFCHFVSPE